MKREAIGGTSSNIMGSLEVNQIEGIREHVEMSLVPFCPFETKSHQLTHWEPTPVPSV